MFTNDQLVLLDDTSNLWPINGPIRVIQDAAVIRLDPGGLAVLHQRGKPHLMVWINWIHWFFWEVKINKNEKKTRPQWSSFRSFTDTEYHDIIWIFKVKIDKHGMINACTHCNCYWLSLQYAFSRTSTPPKPEHRLQLPLQFLHCLTLYLAIFHDIQRAGLNFQWYPDALKFPIS